MEYLVTLIFGLLGIGIGFFIPKVSNQIIAFKLAQRHKQSEINILDQRKWIALITITDLVFSLVKAAFIAILLPTGTAFTSSMNLSS